MRGYRVGEPQFDNAKEIIEFEAKDLGNEHLLIDLAQALGCEPNLESINRMIERTLGPGAKAMWLCDSPEWASERYGPGEAYPVDVPQGAIVGCDLGDDGKLWLWRNPHG